MRELTLTMQLFSLLYQIFRKYHGLKTMPLIFSESLTWRRLGEQQQHYFSENHLAETRPYAVRKLQGSLEVCIVARRTHHPRITYRKVAGVQQALPQP